MFPGLLMAQWHLYDLGTGQTSNRLYAFDKQSAIIAGNDTTLLKTTDGGATWNRLHLTLPYKALYDFKDVDFADALTGFVISSKQDPYNGIMLTSNDAGENWEEVSLTKFSDKTGSDITDPTAGKNLSFRALKFNGETGYAALQWEESATTTKHGYIFKTNDKGVTWSIVSQDLGTIIINSIECVADVVYIGGSASTFMKSSDGGGSWTDYTDAAFLSVNDLRMVDANRIYLATTKGVFYTEDGGGTVTGLNAISSFDVLYLANENILFSGFTTTKTVRSIDNGANWEAASNGQTTNFWDLTYFNDSIWALGNNGIINKLHPSELLDPVADYSYVFKGAEAEFTNKSVNCGSYEWIFTSDSSSTVADPIYRFADYNSHVIELIGENAVTRDTAKYDVAVSQPTADFSFSTEDGNNVSFTNASTNCAEFEWDFGELTGSTEEMTTSHAYSKLGTYTVTLTADNYIEQVTATKEVIIDSVGAHWSINQLDVEQILQKMHVFNDDKAVAVGNSTTIIKTVDGGDTWSEVVFPAENENHILNDIIFFDNSTGLISASASGADNGFLLKSIDQGDNWIEIPLSSFSDGTGDETTDPVAGSKVYFYFMSQIDENTGFVTVRWQDAASVKHGFVYKTTDKGTNWTKSSNDIYVQNSYASVINDISFAPGGQVGYVAGLKFLLKTEDGGATWTNISDDAFGYITEMLVLNQDSVLVASGNGVFRTKDRFANYEFVTTDYSFDIVEISDGKFMAGKNDVTLGVTEDFGDTWVNMGNGLSASFFELTVFNNKVWAFSSKGLTSISYLDNYIMPVANFDFANNNLQVTFTDKSEGAIGWNWDFGDLSESTEQSPVHTYTDKGVYDVVLTVNNLCKKAKKTKQVDINTTGINTPEITEVQVYPNPLRGTKLIVDLGKMDSNVTVEIYDMQGKQVYSSLIYSEKAELNLQIPTGLYVVKVSDGDYSRTLKLIVE